MRVSTVIPNRPALLGILGAFAFLLAVPQKSRSAPATEPEREYTHSSENQETRAIVTSGELDFSGVSIHFYDGRRNPLGVWEKKPGAMRHGEFSPNGNHFLVMMYPSPEQSGSGKPTALSYVLSSSGAVLHQFQSVPEPILRFSPSSDYLFRSTDKAFQVYELDGSHKWSHECLAGPYFSPNGSNIVALESKTIISIHDRDGALQKTVVIPDFDQLREGMPSIRSVSDDGDVFVYLGAAVRRLIVLNRKGDVLKRLPLREFPSSARFADKEKREVIIDLWEHGKPGTREKRRREIRLK